MQQLSDRANKHGHHLCEFKLLQRKVARQIAKVKRRGDGSPKQIRWEYHQNKIYKRQNKHGTQILCVCSDVAPPVNVVKNRLPSVPKDILGWRIIRRIYIFIMLTK